MRLVTRGDLDGLTCAVLLSLNEEIDSIALIHPQDISDGRAEIRSDDIIANLPYHPDCAMWFDHHLHTATPNLPPEGFKGVFAEAPSAARLVYDYYGGEEAMPQLADLVYETDRLDSAQLTPDDVMAPQGFIKLGFTIDGRTGLGTFERYFLHLVDLLKSGTPIEQVLEDPQVKRRCQIIESENEHFCQALRNHSRVEGNVVITDFRDLDHTPVGNRFLVYALFPEVNVSARVHWGPNRSFPMLLLGHSIFRRTCKTNVGELASRYGGGGHRGAGSIPLLDEPDQQIQMVVRELQANG
ncbi:MAG TPA: exopolyphosphatase [Thermoanaerobaculia bacterium]|nr:exopolyphosphatase [Thermoanaerobaculia bacterium]